MHYESTDDVVFEHDRYVHKSHCIIKMLFFSSKLLFIIYFKITHVCTRSLVRGRRNARVPAFKTARSTMKRDSCASFRIPTLLCLLVTKQRHSLCQIPLMITMLSYIYWRVQFGIVFRPISS